MEIKDVLDYFGMDAEKVKSVDDFKNAFSKDFVKKEAIEADEDLVGRIFGKKIGIVETRFNRTAKALGVEFTPEEQKDAIENRIEKLGEKAKAKYEAEISELKSKNTDESLKNLQNKYDKLKQKNEETNSLLDQLRGDNEKLKNDFVVTKRQTKIESVLEKTLGGLSFKKDISQIEKAGFNAIINSKYAIDLDENEEPFIKEKTTGKRIQSTAKAGEFAGIDEVFKKEAAEAKLLVLVPTTQTTHKEAPKSFTPANPQNPNPPAPQFGRGPIKIHPSAQQNEG